MTVHDCSFTVLFCRFPQFRFIERLSALTYASTGSDFRLVTTNAMVLALLAQSPDALRSGRHPQRKAPEPRACGTRFTMTRAIGTQIKTPMYLTAAHAISFGRPVVGWEQFCVPYYHELLCRCMNPACFSSGQTVWASSIGFSICHPGPSIDPFVFTESRRRRNCSSMRGQGRVVQVGRSHLPTTIPAVIASGPLSSGSSSRIGFGSSPLRATCPRIKDGLPGGARGVGPWAIPNGSQPLRRGCDLDAICMALLDWVPVEPGKYYLWNYSSNFAKMLIQQRQASRPRQTQP